MEQSVVNCRENEVFDLGYLAEVLSFQAFSQTRMVFIVSRIFFQ